MKTIASGEFNHEGYTVTVIRGSKVIHEYNAGNHWQDSTVTVDWRSPSALKLRRLHIMCIRTTKEIAREYNADKWGVERVSEN